MEKGKQVQWMHKVIVGTTLFVLGSSLVVGAFENVHIVPEKVHQVR
ncbi:hypothetical protein GLV88_02060 [Staphylococcus hyicus]|nr:hypothetical protein [Staphylococcus hyicus]MCQ9300694.1 hypothetical protein [Staphylococcus hyicus]MDP4461417.1 hypothetical protein [Staphylococcus hyicus]MDY3698034.1 hypothetical protein [Staphylococcus hyicus]NJH80829.1 hypothetical protein [Staphylococcus hyicus]NJH99246.1 hypothetical protein [Staphylococcus hyicus]